MPLACQNKNCQKRFRNGKLGFGDSRVLELNGLSSKQQMNHVVPGNNFTLDRGSENHSISSFQSRASWNFYLALCREEPGGNPGQIRCFRSSKSKIHQQLGWVHCSGQQESLNSVTKNPQDFHKSKKENCQMKEKSTYEIHSCLWPLTINGVYCWWS